MRCGESRRTCIGLALGHGCLGSFYGALHRLLQGLNVLLVAGNHDPDTEGLAH